MEAQRCGCNAWISFSPGNLQILVCCGKWQLQAIAGFWGRRRPEACRLSGFCQKFWWRLNGVAAMQRWKLWLDGRERGLGWLCVLPTAFHHFCSFLVYKFLPRVNVVFLRVSRFPQQLLKQQLQINKNKRSKTKRLNDWSMCSILVFWGSKLCCPTFQSKYKTITLIWIE